MSTAAEQWWLDEVSKEPEQGDILDLLPLARVIYPVKAIAKHSFKGGQGWIDVPAPTHGLDFFAQAKGKHSHALLLSHGCQIDKPNNNIRIQLAPIAPLANLTEAQRENTLSQKNKRQLPLQGIPGLGDYYADLQTILSFDIVLLKDCKRLASMTPLGIKRLQLQLIAFFTHKDFSAVLDDLPDLPGGPQKA